MNLLTRIRLAVGNYIKEKGQGILIFIGIILILYFVGSRITMTANVNNPKKVDNSRQPVVSDTNPVSRTKHNRYEEEFKKFFDLCNQRDFEKAYTFLSEKNKEYFGGYEGFLAYITNVFREPKRYALNSYSKVDNNDIYQVKYFSDILATGLTREKFTYIDSKVTFVTENNNLKLNIGGFIDFEKSNSLYESNNVRIDIPEISKTYSSEIYEMEITNKTEYHLVIKDYSLNNEVSAKVGSEIRSDVRFEPIILEPFENRTFYVEIQNFVDSNRTIQKLDLNAVRIVKEYKGLTAEQINAGIEIPDNDILETFSISVPIERED